MTIRVKFAEKNIPIPTEENLQDPGVWNAIILFLDPFMKN
jgi:hypothetical protein